MRKFQPGTNRDIVSKLLSSKPQSTEELAKHANSVLGQLRPMGLAVSDKDAVTGVISWIKGDGKPISKKNKRRSPDKDARQRILAYLQNRVGQDITTEMVVRELKLQSPSLTTYILSELVKAGKAIRRNTGKPFVWVMNASIRDPEQSDLLPPPSDFKSRPQDTPPPQQVLIPGAEAIMQTSSAISHLMQSEQQKIVYQQTLQQILVIYEQLGNILEAAGLIEE